jgi:hypothetical protein
MRRLLDKLNYKGQERIALINAEDDFALSLSDELKGVVVDREIDPRYPYSFIIIFVKNVSEVEHFTPMAIHNLMADGIMWFCFPKKSSKEYHPDLDRDNGWKTLIDSGLQGIRIVAVDNDWSGLRFRNAKFIRSARTKPSQ